MPRTPAWALNTVYTVPSSENMSRIEAHSEKKRRLAILREEKEAERSRATDMARKYFWLTMLWSTAAQELIGKVLHILHAFLNVLTLVQR